MKKIPALLLVVIMIFQLVSFNVSSADDLVTLTGIEYTAGTPREISKDTGNVMSYRNNPLGWKVSLPYASSALKLTYRTATGDNGIINIRLGGASGEIIGTLETDKITSSWSDYTNVISLSKPLEGDQDVWITVSKGTIGPGGAHWIRELKFLSNDVSKSFATFKEESAYVDISEDQNNHEINLLSDLGIFSTEDTSFMPYQSMKRVEFVSALGKIIGAENFASEESPFKDVESGSSDADILSGLYNLGIIKGDTDGHFRPISFITPAEAATVCTNALGYGTFPKDMNTVLDLADSLGLFDGIKLTKSVTRSQGAKLLYNLFLADYLAVKEVGEDEIFYNPTKNYLEKATSYKHSKGIMTANDVTKLYSAQKSEGIWIDGVQYLTEKAMPVDYLGAYCEFFYHEDNGDRILDAIRPMPKVEWTYIESTPDIRFDEISERKIEYTKISTDEEFEYEIGLETAIIYNATALNKSLMSLIPDSREFEGAITTIDNDGDGILETIWIDHVTRVVEVLAVSNGRIKDELTDALYNTTDKTFELYINGNSAYVDELQKGAVLTIYESSDDGKDKYVRSIADENLVEGTIEKIANGIYTINGSEYKVSSACEDELHVGLTGTFALDRHNFIVNCTEGKSSELMLGLYLANSGLDANALDATFEIKLLTDTGIVKYKVAQKTIADGVTVKKAKDFYNGTGLFTGIKNVTVNSPVLYRINANGEVSMIDTINDGTKNKEDQLTNILSAQDNNPVNEVTASTFRVYNKTLVANWVSKYGVSSKVKVIGLSSDRNETNYKILSGYTAGADYDFSMAPYSFSRDYMVADVLIVSDYTLLSGSSAFPFIVDRVTETLDESGNVVKKIQGFSKDSKAEYLVDAESYASNATFRTMVDSIEKGNLVRPFLTNGKISDMDVVYIPEPQQGEKFGPTTNASGITTLLNKNVRNSTGRNNSATVNLFEIEEIKDNFIKVNMQSNESGDWTDQFWVFNAQSASAALCEKNPNGTYTFTYGMPLDAMVKGDIVVGTRGTSPGIINGLYIFRDNSQ